MRGDAERGIVSPAPDRTVEKTMNIGIRLHDTAPGTLKERLQFAKAQGFSCAHIALAMTVAGFSMQEAPEKLTPEFAHIPTNSVQEKPFLELKPYLGLFFL